MALKLSLGVIFTQTDSLCFPSLYLNPSICITITNVRTSLTRAQTQAKPSQLECTSICIHIHQRGHAFCREGTFESITGGKLIGVANKKCSEKVIVALALLNISNESIMGYRTWWLIWEKIYPTCYMVLSWLVCVKKTTNSKGSPY